MNHLNHYVNKLFYARDCPDPKELLAYQADLLPAAKERLIAQHLVACSPCQAKVEQLTELSHEPDPLLDRVLQTGKRVLMGIFQAPPSEPAFALLGDDSEQHSYQAGEYQIIIETSSLLAGSNIWQVEGKLINPHNPLMLYEGHASLLQGNQAVATDIVDEFGFFALQELNAGEYTLHIELPETIIPIQNFTIRAEA